MDSLQLIIIITTVIDNYYLFNNFSTNYFIVITMNISFVNFIMLKAIDLIIIMVTINKIIIANCSIKEVFIIQK